MILRQIGVLFSAYRTADYQNPEGFMASLGRALQEYPDEVILFVTSPTTGLQRTSKFPPTLTEVIEACDRRAAELKRQERFRNWGAGNDHTPMLEAPKEQRSSYAELKAKFGDSWGIENPDVVARAKPQPIDREKVWEHYRKFNIDWQPK